MKDITIICDRCGKVVNGVIDEFHLDKSVKLTGGFYDVTESEYARWEEERICDDCMHSDPKYIETYGDLISKRVDPPQ